MAELDGPPFSGLQGPTVFPLPRGRLRPRGPMGKIKKDTSCPLKYFFFLNPEDRRAHFLPACLLSFGRKQTSWF